jgi:tRNA(Leu) C34 or U34 (ribose-2'-O)-methylase TrmL
MDPRFLKLMLNLVLHAPRIPQNTGQLARACFAMNCRLHLIRPLGFRLDAPGLRRAAVGYLDARSSLGARASRPQNETNLGTRASRPWNETNLGTRASRPQEPPDAADGPDPAVSAMLQGDLVIHADADAFWAAVPDPARVWLIAKSGHLDYTEVEYRPGDWLLMGNETEGLPPAWLSQYSPQTVRIPMPNPAARCLNLSTAATVVMFEALRQS